MSVKFQDYYKTLGVARTAKANDIKRAYRKLAAKYHPDRNGGDPRMEEKFKQINEAYEVLKDPDKRSRYNQLGSNWKHGQTFDPNDVFNRFGMRGDQASRRGSGKGSTRFDMGGGEFSDFFESFLGGLSGGFGGGRGRPGGFDGAGMGGGPFGAQQAGPTNTKAEMTISLEDAYRGTTRSLAFNRNSGNGISERQQYDVKIPAGIRNGQKIRLKGQGSSSGAQAGDIIITVKVAPHPRYKLIESDLEAPLPLAPWEAALGAQVSVLTLDGQVDVKAPPGIRAGQRLRIKGRGFPSKDGRGDLYLRVELVNPPKMSGDELKLMKQWAGLSDFDPRS